MAIRWKNCPYCGANLYFGGGKNVTFGKPLKRCPSCNKIYKDSDIIDWSSESILEKFKYCFANGRIGLIGLSWLTTFLVGYNFEWDNLFLYSLIGPLTMFVFCVLYVISEARIHYYQGAKNVWDHIALIIFIIGKCVKWGFLIPLFAVMSIAVLYAILHLLNII